MQGSIYTPQTEKETPSISICQSSSQFFSNNSSTMKRTMAVLLPNMGQICQHQSNVFTILKKGENRSLLVVLLLLSAKIIYSDPLFRNSRGKLLDFLLLEWIFFSYIQKLEKIRSVLSIFIEDALKRASLPPLKESQFDQKIFLKVT